MTKMNGSDGAHTRKGVEAVQAVRHEEVCFPLTAIGVLYDPSLDLFMDKDTIKLPIVEFPTDKLAAVAA